MKGEGNRRKDKGLRRIREEGKNDKRATKGREKEKGR